MISEEKRKSFNEIQKLVNSLETFYLEIYSKSSQTMEIIMSICHKFKYLNEKKNSTYILPTLSPIGIFEKIWEAGAKKISYPKKQLFIFQEMRGRMKQFTGEFKHIKKNFKIHQKQIEKLNDNQTSLQKLVKNANDPIVYYNPTELVSNKKALADKFSQYNKRKQQYDSEKQNRQSIISELNQLYQWFNRKLQSFFIDLMKIFDQYCDTFTTIIHNFFHYMIEQIIKQIEKFQSKSRSSILQRKKSQSIFSKNIDHDKYFNELKNIVKFKSDQIKNNQTTFSEIKTMVEHLLSVRKHYEKQLSQMCISKQKISQISDQINFFRSYSYMTNSLINTLDCYDVGFKSILERYPSLNKLDLIKLSIVEGLKKIINKQVKSLDNIEQLKSTILKQIKTLEQSEDEGKVILSGAILDSLNQFYQQMKKVDLNLFSSQKEVKNQKSKMKKIIVSKDDFITNFIPNQKLEKQIQSVLQQKNLFPDIQKQEPQKIYSCALQASILLSGKVKLYSEVIGFQSFFNQNNVFFGTTNLLIHKSQIIQISKETKLLIPNTIKIVTKKGTIFLTSLFKRDKTFDLMIMILQGKKINRTISSDQPISDTKQDNKVQQITLDQEQLSSIRNKSVNYDKLIQQPKSVQVFVIVIQGLSLRQIYKQFYHENTPINYKKKSYKNFKQFVLLHNNNSDIFIETLSPQAPSYYDSSSSSKLSQIIKSERVMKYKHQIDSVPIPFVPKFGNCTQKQVFEWGETLTSGVPYSDSIVTRNKTIVQEIAEGVRINQSLQIIFTKNISFEKIIRSSMLKELQKSGKFIKHHIEKFSQQIVQQKKKLSQSKKSTLNLIEQNNTQDKYKDLQQEFNKKISAIKTQNKRNIIIAGIIFIIVMILSRIF